MKQTKSKTFVKKVLLSFLVGSGYIITFIVAQFLLLASTGVELSVSIASLGEGHREILNNPLLIATAAISMIITGALIIIWAVVKGRIAPYFGLEKNNITFKKSPKRIVGLIAVLFVVGVVTSLIFGGFNEYVGSLSPDTNLRSLNSLFAAIFTFQPIMILWTFAAIVVFGALVTIAGALYNPIKAKLPEKYTP